MPGVQVDGNDIFACYKATRDAIERARRGEGPSLIEAVTYRLADHTTADDARRYRDAAEYETAAGRDPLIRTRRYLESKSLWDDARQTKLEERAAAVVHEVVEAAMKMPPPQTQDIFAYTFDQLPDELAKQMQTMRTDSIGQDPEQVGLSSVPRDAHRDAQEEAQPCLKLNLVEAINPAADAGDGAR